MKQKNIQSEIKNNETNNTTLPKEEIKNLETRLKTLKQRARGEQSNNNPYIVPVSIVVAGIFIAAAIFFSGGSGIGTSNTNVVGTDRQAQPAPIANSGNSDNVKPVTSEDHIKGNLNAPVKIVEFSDIDCPFCTRFHPTMQQVVEEYGDDVAWVYRHFPLTSIHPDAPKKAEATECAGEQGGNDGFWTYLDYLFENETSVAQLSDAAQELGFNRAEFEQCLNSNKYAEKIQAHIQDAIASGGTGTPYSIVIAPNGDTFPISGAQPYSSLKITIDLALKSK